MYKTSALSVGIPLTPVVHTEKSGSTMMPAAQFAKGRLSHWRCKNFAWFSAASGQQWRKPKVAGRAFRGLRRAGTKDRQGSGGIYGVCADQRRS
jgi:hypothetical protein